MNYSESVNTPHVVLPVYFITVALALLIIRPFEFLVPGFSVIKQLWIVFLFLFTAVVYLIWLVQRKAKLHSFELYVLLLLCAVPLISALAAKSEFSQPIFYGLMTQRKIMLCTTVLLLIYFYKVKYLRLRDVEFSLLVLAWICLIGFTSFSIVANPADYTDAQFVGGENTGETSFKFNIYMVILGFFYYLYQGYVLKKNKAYLFAALFLVFLIVEDGGRTMLISLLASVLFFLCRWGSLKRLIVMLPKLLLSMMMLLTILYVFNAEFFSNLAHKYQEAFAVVSSGERGEDASANARIAETLLALPYIQKNWLIGNGDISNDWHGGYEGVLGGYFYPSDIGLIGVVYSFGLLGAMLFIFQFVFALRFSKVIGRLQTPMQAAIKCFLLYFAIHSVVNGRFVHMVDVSMFFIAVLYLAAIQKSNLLLFGKRMSSYVKVA